MIGVVANSTGRAANIASRLGFDKKKTALISHPDHSRGCQLTVVVFDTLVSDELISAVLPAVSASTLKLEVIS